jgi:predicted MFS family arabinose efflux permease
MSSHLNNPAKSFGWFYTAPYYAAEFAPAIGGLTIFLWGFNGVFILSILIHAINILYTFFSIPEKLNSGLTMCPYGNSLNHFREVMKKFFEPDIFPVLIFSLAVVVLGGFYQSFFLIFLKSIGWQKTEILAYASLSSILFLPLSLWGIRILSGSNVVKTIFISGAVFAISSILVGLMASLAGFIGILVLMEINELGSFVSGSSRSGFVTKIFSSFPHKAAVLDTIFSPLGVALGSLLGGVIVGYAGYSGIFIFGGILILFLGFLIKRFSPLDMGA